MNLYAVRAIYVYELSRWFRTLTQSLLSPVISTALYFVVFGSAIGSRMTAIDGVTYAAFIVPGALGGRVISGLVSIAMTLLVALFVWEVANAAVERRLADHAVARRVDENVCAGQRVMPLLPRMG